jgi:hypothetical protein
MEFCGFPVGSANFQSGNQFCCFPSKFGIPHITETFPSQYSTEFHGIQVGSANVHSGKQFRSFLALIWNSALCGNISVAILHGIPWNIYPWNLLRNSKEVLENIY